MFPDSLSADRLALLNELAGALEGGRPPALGKGDMVAWANAFNDAMVHDRLDLVMHSARYLAEAFPRLTLARQLCQTFERIPPADGEYLPFHDDFREEVQIVRRDGADTAMLVFCGRAHQPALPICVMHRWLGRLPVSVIYLRDFHVLYYLAGIASLAPDRNATLASLRGIVASLGASRILCFGNSGGVFGALHYGLDLGADKVLCLSGTTNISAAFNARLRSAKSVGRLHEQISGADINLRSAYMAAAQAPHVRLVYANNNWDDRIHAEHMTGLPTVTLQAVSGSQSHNVITDLICREQYQGLLDWFVCA